MLLNKKNVSSQNKNELNTFNSLAYASCKLWNIVNYEKKNYKALGFADFPNWYNEKKDVKMIFVIEIDSPLWLIY